VTNYVINKFILIRIVKNISWVDQYLVIVLLGIAIIIVGIIVGFYSRPTIQGSVDLSWPNCNRLSDNSYALAIVGTNGGLDFRPNPCLGNEARMSNKFVLYANTGNPGFPLISKFGKAGPLICPKDNNLICYSFNYGYQAAKYSIRQANLESAAGSTFWWLDVESINSWTNSIDANRADIEGMVYALRSNPFLTPKIGIYTAYNQWLSVVGHWDIGLDLWLGTGDTTLLQAKQSCRQPSFVGASIVLSQYTVGNLDFNFSCSNWQIRNYFND